MPSFPSNYHVDRVKWCILTYYWWHKFKVISHSEVKVSFCNMHFSQYFCIISIQSSVTMATPYPSVSMYHIYTWFKRTYHKLFKYIWFVMFFCDWWPCDCNEMIIKTNKILWIHAVVKRLIICTVLTLKTYFQYCDKMITIL